jgi:hypothetical protein
MHRVDSDEHLSNKFQNSNPPTTAGTLLEKDWHNAMQEDYSQVLEAMGATLAASGSADETAGWVTGRDAFMVKFLGADVRRFGADPTGSADSTSAFNSALAQSPILLIPEGTFKLSGTVTVPAYSAILGRGRKSIIKIDGNGAMFDVENSDVLIRGIYFTYLTGSLGANSRQIKIRNTVQYPVWIDKCYFGVGNTAALTSIEIDDEVGRSPIKITNCHFYADVNTGVSLRVGVDSSSKSSHLAVVSCSFDDGVAIEANYGDECDSSKFIGCSLYDGSVVFNSAQGFHFHGCSIDVDSYDFNNCEGVVFESCYHPHTLANTIPTDAAALASYFVWKRCTTDDGFTMAEGVRGTSSNGDDLTNEAKLTIDANKTVAATTIETISTTNGYSLTATQHVGPNVSQTKLTLVNASTGNFIKATGSGLLAVTVHVRIDPNGANQDEVCVRLVPSAGQTIYVPFGYTDDGGGGHMLFSGTFFFALPKEGTVHCDVSNRDATVIYVQGGLSRDLIRSYWC